MAVPVSRVGRKAAPLNNRPSTLVWNSKSGGVMTRESSDGNIQDGNFSEINPFFF